MTYVICEPCIEVKDSACVDVCPVDCIHPLPDADEYEDVDQLYIDPEECIDCGVWRTRMSGRSDLHGRRCPEGEWEEFIDINAEYFE